MESNYPPEVLRMLSDPLRWQIVTELGKSDRRVGELVRQTAKPQNLVSYHLSELRNAGLVSARRSSADGRDVYYRAELARCGDLLALAATALHPAMSIAAPGLPSTGHRRSTDRLLFLCTGNSARSQIAEALVEHQSNGTVQARSAGSHPKPLHPNAVSVMAERGIDIAGRKSKPLSRFSRSRFTRVITLCDKVREVCPEFPGNPPTAHWSVPNPADAGANDASTLPTFELITDEIETRVSFLLAELRTA